jgi:predicted nucleic acid-binding protein
VKVLLDTNVLIGFFRNPRWKEEFESRTHRPLLFMSSDVALELFAGCRTPRQDKALTNFLKPFEKAGRMVTPDHACFRQAAGTCGIEPSRSLNCRLENSCARQEI